LTEELGYDINEVYFSGGPLGEKTIPDLDYSGNVHWKVKVDGYIPLEVRQKKEPEATKPLCIEFNGCAWHGCDKCFKRDDKTVGRKTMETRRHETEERQRAIENKGIEVKVIWEHDVTKMIKEDPVLKRTLEMIEDVSPIDPRDGFFGGKFFTQKSL